ncbi:RtcB family protein [Tepidanaerobacter sp. EBM-38]|uniref:RtcB family protein n=1 Tax=Tepidanaerobacter sp. EBM-38 TaxID=1918496 RepID=UPI000B1C6352|nr:RtcB family protein [Tepidanaerobacter sp. EBM-38]
MKKELKEVSKNCYILSSGKDKVDIHVYLNRQLFEEFVEDEALNQLYNASLLPGVVSPIIGMPDIHTGYGLPIGGVMATDYEVGVVSAGAVGMDINCGVRLITSKIPAEEINKSILTKLLKAISKRVPLGVGKSSELKVLKKPNLEGIAYEGVEHYIKKGFGRIADLDRIEDHGCIKGANLSAVPNSALKRTDQLATIGGGNHFIEIGRIGSVFDEELASKWGLNKQHIYVMIHTGSRGFGHQICCDYSTIMWENSDKNKTRAPQKGLACAPISSRDGQNYLQAMACAANYAFTNRQIITHFVREAFVEVIKKPEADLGLDLLYDVAHNIAKKEKYNKWLLVHRKGATRALPAGHEDNPACYRETGHPAIIPGSMGTGSYVVIGTPEIEKTFCSVNHGAGRVMSRKQARSEFTREGLLNQMGHVVVIAKDIKSLLDEAPLAYKDIDNVVYTLVEAGLTKPIVKLKPMGVLKGEGNEA